MKQKQFKNAWWRSILSFVTLGIFAILALGSLDEFMKYDIKHLGEGIYEETDYLKVEDDIYTQTTGKRDDKGRWQGPVTIFRHSEYSIDRTTEEVTMVDGKRDGISKTTRIKLDGEEEVVTNCYSKGVWVPCKKSAETSLSGNSAYQILSKEYPWYFLNLICFGFDSTYVESYLDTLETLLYSYEFGEAEFNIYYEDALDVLGETPYDSIITLQSTLFLFQGLEEMKNAVLRLAVIDHYRSADIPTYDIVTTTYPGYLHALNDSGDIKPGF